MKTIILILAIVGGIISWTSNQIAGKIWKDEEVKDDKKLYIKLVGLVLVIIAVILAFFT